MVPNAALLNAQHYKVKIKGKVEQSRERSKAIPYTLVWKLLNREPSGHPPLKSPTLLISKFQDDLKRISISLIQIDLLDLNKWY